MAARVRSWQVVSLDGEHAHEVKASSVEVRDGNLIFYYCDGPYLDVVRLFAAGYWAQAVENRPEPL